ncbi:MAG: hypothetical protein HC906_04230 [Bacteroidales bacterium]|nr:hypothetical protein [Bacteroidales bacterium]
MKNLTAKNTFTGYRGNNFYFEGIRVRELHFGKFKKGAAMAIPGTGIFVGPGKSNDIDLLKHEFGHYSPIQQMGTPGILVKTCTPEP